MTDPDLPIEQARRWARARRSGPVAEVEVVVEAWADEPLAESTRARLGDLARRFATRLAATGVASLTEATPADADGYLWAPTRRNAPPSLHTVHLRRTTLRAVYRTLTRFQPGVTDPTHELDLPARVAERPRALTRDEVALVRTAALGRTRQPLRAATAVALAEAAATTGEIPRIRWADLDIPSGAVSLPGASPTRARTNWLTVWGQGVLARRQQELDPQPTHTVVPHRSGLPTDHAAQAATANQLTKILRASGLDDPRIRPGSIRLWAATTVLHDRGIEAAARTLGIDSLDAAADTLEYRWQVAK
jgi:integrase/recombinase XerC